MTRETLELVEQELKTRGVPARIQEGCLLVSTPGTTSLEFDDISDFLVGNQIDFNGEVIETYQCSLRGHTTDVQAVADFVACIHTGLLEVLKGNS